MLKIPFVLLSLFGKQCSKLLLYYYHCLANSAQNTYCSIIIVCKQCSKCLLFYYHCLANNAQNSYCSIIIVWQTMLKCLLLYYHCLANNAQNAYCLSIVCETIIIELFQWLPSECSKHDIMFIALL